MSILPKPKRVKLRRTRRLESRLAPRGFACDLRKITLTLATTLVYSFGNAMAALAAIAAPLRTSSSIISFRARVAAQVWQQMSNCSAGIAITKRKLSYSRCRTANGRNGHDPIQIKG